MGYPAGPKNLLTDVDGLRVGNAHDDQLRSGVTVVLCDEPFVAAVHVMGGAPGTRETDLLEPHNMVECVHGLVLSGGSSFGLDAASGVQAYLREKGIGLNVRGHCIPIVPAAILFDLSNDGNKDWGAFPPYRELGMVAAQSASADFEIGTTGAGTGALTYGLKGGLGSTSCILPDGTTVGSLAAVNSVGSPVIGSTRHFWAAALEKNGEFGGLGFPTPMPADADAVRIKFRDSAPEFLNTTIGVVATDCVLSKAQAKRLAISAHAGAAKAVWPSHMPIDGDLIFAVATGKSGKTPEPADFVDLCAAASATMARSIARGVYAASPAPGDIFPSWSQLAG